MPRRALAALVLGIAATASAASAQGVDTAKVDAILARRGTAPAPGCALAVARDGNVAYAKGYGLASVEHAVPITPRTVFDVGSVSKQFTAATVLLLAREGRLSLDDDVRRWIPELPNVGHTTLRQLLHHTSGWRDYLDLMTFAGWDDRDHTTDADALGALERAKALNFPPDSAFRYSNTGYFLLSQVVKRAGGRGLDSLGAAGLFGPLGMSDTHFLTDAREVIPRKATGYARGDGGRWTVAMSNWEQIGDGGVQTTVLDLLKWAAELDHPRVLGDSLVRLMETPGRLRDGTSTGYGFGLMTDEYRGQRRVQHGGSWAGYRAAILRLPKVDAAVICNTGGADDPSALAQRVADLWLDADGVPPAARPNATLARAVSSESADALASYAGTYTDGALGLIRLAAAEGTLAIAQPATGRAVRAFVPLGAGRFADTLSGVEYRVSGPQLTVTPPRGDVLHLTRVPAAEPLDAAALGTYAGRYASDEANVTWTVEPRNGRLTVVPPRGDPIPLTPIYRDAFAGPGRVRFVRDAKGKVTAFTVTTRGVQALRFERR